MKTIGLVFGGKSVEHDVSVISAQIISKGFESLKNKFKLVPIYINKKGNWFPFSAFPPLEKIKSLKEKENNILFSIRPEGEKLILKTGVLGKTIAIDIILPIIHGTNGEDGTLQGFFETLNIPYVGAGVLGSAVGMDKILMKDILKSNKLPVVDYLSFTRNDLKEKKDLIAEEIESRLPYPVFVKPSNLGSSIGITKSEDRKSLIFSLEVAAAYSERIIAERGVKNAKEINCAVLDDGGKIIPSLLEEPMHYTEFLTFEEKYVGGGKGGTMKGLKSKVKIPAELSEKITAEIKNLALKTFKVLDCASIARVDFLVEENRKVFINEINTLPGSLQQHLWKASSIDLPNLLEKIISSAERKFSEKKKNLTLFNSPLLN